MRRAAIETRITKIGTTKIKPVRVMVTNTKTTEAGTGGTL
jgi:hypothetical protein